MSFPGFQGYPVQAAAVGAPIPAGIPGIQRIRNQEWLTRI